MSSLTKLDESVISSLIINGDISKLNPSQKVEYYKAFCERIGLDPVTQPFKILKLQGKEILYCDRSGTQQLNKLHNVSHQITSRDLIESAGIYQVTAKASLPDGRFSESIGAVNIQNLKGDAYANAIMKAETKAKRRATLDLLGLGMLDETEIETIPNAHIVEETNASLIEESATDSQLILIENLIHNSTIDEKRKTKIENEMSDYSKDRAEKCIDYLKQNQRETLNEQFENALSRDED